MRLIDRRTPETKQEQLDDYETLKAALHRFVIDRIEDDNIIYDDDSKKLEEAIGAYIRQYCRIYEVNIGREKFDNLEKELLDEIVGFGPLQVLLDDPDINDILINGPRRIFVERRGVLEQSSMRFLDDRHVLRVIRRMISPLGRRIDESSPIVDGRLADGSRINAIVPPLALDGPCLSIRKFRKDPLTAEELLAGGSITKDALDFLSESVAKRRNILISGATGSGKTTLLNILSQYIPATERIVTIEDAAELQLRNSHVVRLETRPENNEGVGQVTAGELVKNALRMRPDRIIVGESRGGEVVDMLQAMNTGHNGSMTTVHANSASDAITRLEMMVGMSGFKGSSELILKMIGSALDMIVHIGRQSNGHRCVMQICKLTNTANGLQLRELFALDAGGNLARNPSEQNVPLLNDVMPGSP
ncbi:MULTISPECIES: CpaF family protein [Spongiibacter]|jgi:pilus assembly protein CpaF|uniref:CpaF family protein n=1 Tax=Spongiibacter TaxID=630749 RepID=UPI000C09961F|nr:MULTISPECIES: CpaF family protein [Spongiibacter]MAK43096.1 ATPase [Spongiibacter sp.]MBM7422805.1 pilus assembly protein CpaF [Spongiibacter marinus]|tara:strand:- start:3035 stop:4291 length:1257 start_codon:yes stop_codon:yes gene_type:complete